MATMESSKQNENLVYDEIRKAWFVATPEELVRQKLIQKMLYELSYPRELIGVEKLLSDLSLKPAPKRRVDVVCFAKGMQGRRALAPLLLIECKEEQKAETKALEQVKGYNRYVQAPFLAVAHPEGEKVLFLSGKQSFQELGCLPSYFNLLQVIETCSFKTFL